MGKVTKNHKHLAIKQHHKRIVKIKKLRSRLQNAEPKAKEAILLKLKKIHAAAAPEGKSK